MKEERSFVPEGNRYYFDNRLSPRKGWAQVDSDQDAWYYGNWANPFKLRLVSYTEGDVVIQTAETEEEFINLMRKFKAWNDEMGYSRLFGIDPLMNEEITKRFNDLGLGDLLH